uniref:Uncharacterized protein n=1 Tax=Arundo donax TaxID=35708 RepID=A0A0A8YCA1_ARUDO
MCDCCGWLDLCQILGLVGVLDLRRFRS